MPKFNVILPIVGYAEVYEIEADDKADAIQKALWVPWEDLEINEVYTTEKVVEGNVCYHPFREVEAIPIGGDE